MRRGSIVRIVAVGVLVGVLVSLVAVLIDWLPDPASEQADRIFFVFWFATIISIVIFALVAAVILYSIVRFRAAPDDDTDGPPIHGHTGLEIWWTAIPTVLVTAIAVVSAIVLARNDDLGDDPLRVEVTAAQFAWQFTYPDQEDLVSGQLVLPVDRPVELRLRANDVLHSFWIPDMAQKQDAVPGIVTRLVITPTKTGRFPIVCTELCGLGHAAMRATARVLGQQEFAAWVEEQQAGGGGGGTGGGDDGAALFTAQGCGGCHAFEPAGTDAEIGPALDDLAAAAEDAGQPLDEYVRAAIVEPDRVVADGYQPGVMPGTYGNILSDEQLDALVEFLTQGGEGSQ